MRLLLLGKNGQVGTALQQRLAPLGALTVLDRNGTADLCGDLQDLPGLAATVRRLRPDVIVNAAAYTAVDAAEQEPERARRVNAEAPAVLAQAARACGALLVHYSSDYVFDGQGQAPWREQDSAAPLNVYGSSKLAGDTAIAASGCRHLILRVSWVHAASSHNFVTAVLQRAARGERIAVVGEQYGAPTSARLIAQVTAQAIVQIRHDASKAGLYHLAAGGSVNRLDWAAYVLSHARKIKPDACAAWPEPVPMSIAASTALARRPRNCRLATRRVCAVFALELPPWQEGVAQTVAEWLA